MIKIKFCCCKDLEKLVKTGYLKEKEGEGKQVLVLPENYQGPGNTCMPTYHPMNYCPFCGLKLELDN